MGAKKRQTMGKLIRERERAEKRARKQEKKDEKKALAAAIREGGIQPESGGIQSESGGIQPESTDADANGRPEPSIS